MSRSGSAVTTACTWFDTRVTPLLAQHLLEHSGVGVDGRQLVGVSLAVADALDPGPRQQRHV